MPKRGDNIYKRKDGRWEGRYVKEYLEGKTRYGYVYGKTYKETKEKLFAAANNSLIPLQQTSTRNINFKDISEEWLKHTKPQLKESSIVKYRNILERYVYPKFGSRNVIYITYTDIMNFNIELLNSGGVKNNSLSAKTVSSIMSVLKSIFDYIARNKNINMPDFSAISGKHTSRQMRILSIQEQEKLTAYLYENMNLCNLGILLCMNTGIRIGELCALKWEDISFDESYIFIRKTMQRLQIDNGISNKTKVTITEPKSSCSSRKIPIPSGIYQVLKTKKCSNNTFFLTGSKSKFIEPRTMQNRFKAILKECEIDDANFHALRHTFATRCIEIGVDAKSLSEILGHATVNITLNRYVHPSMELKQKNIDMLSDFLAVK